MEQTTTDIHTNHVIRMVRLGLQGDLKVLRAAGIMAYNTGIRELGEPTVDTWMELTIQQQSVTVHHHPALTLLDSNEYTQLRELLCRC